MGSSRDRRKQHGAALLTAMLTVALVATLAAGAFWQQWRAVEVEQAQRTQQQMGWILLGAQDWARLILREDANAGSVDHLSEPWALPLQEARLKSFLNSEAQMDEADNLDQSFLSGRISDLQARLNVLNLVNNKKVDADAFEAFGRLFAALGLPPNQLVALTLQLQNAAQGQGLLMPERLSDLQRFGLSGPMLQALSPYVTVLPSRTPVNLNTAPAEVLMAVLPGLNAAGAQALVQRRASSHFKSVEEALQAAPDLQPNLQASHFSVSSRYFEVRGLLRLDKLTVEQLSILERDSGQIRVLSRHTGSLQSFRDVYADR